MTITFAFGYLLIINFADSEKKNCRALAAYNNLRAKKQKKMDIMDPFQVVDIGGGPQRILLDSLDIINNGHRICFVVQKQTIWV
jgi:hypothetical protein